MIPRQYPRNTPATPTGVTQQYHRDITAIPSNGTGRFHIKPTGTPHPYCSNLGTPCSNPAANAGIPQQDHSNTQAILQQYYNDNNIAVILSTHRKATATPQPYHSNPPAIPLEIPHESHRISHQYRSNTAVKQKHFHSNTIAV